MAPRRRSAAAARLVRSLESGFRGPAWHGPAVLETLRGLPPERVADRPVPGAHSIAELVRHIGAWKRIVASWARGAPRGEIDARTDWPEACPCPWEEQLARLEACHRELVTAVQELHDGDLARSVGETDLGVAIEGVVQHDLYHAGQIALLRRALDLPLTG